MIYSTCITGNSIAICSIKKIDGLVQGAPGVALRELGWRGLQHSHNPCCRRTEQEQEREMRSTGRCAAFILRLRVHKNNNNIHTDFQSEAYGGVRERSDLK